MAELKTKASDQDPTNFLNSIEPERKRQDGFRLLDVFKEVTGEKAVMWGSSIVGFGKYHYKSERSRQEGYWPMVGFSPRKQALTLYLTLDGSSADELLARLGKHKGSIGCLYINKLEDVEEQVLRSLIAQSYENMKSAIPIQSELATLPQLEPTPSYGRRGVAMGRP